MGGIAAIPKRLETKEGERHFSKHVPFSRFMSHNLDGMKITTNSILERCPDVLNALC